MGGRLDPPHDRVVLARDELRTLAHLERMLTERSDDVVTEAETMEVASPTEQRQSGWVAWVSFAAVMMIILGLFHAMDGLVAIFKDEFYVVGRNGLVVEVDYTAWGFLHLALGIVVILAAASMLRGHMAGRIAGVATATVSAVVNLAFLAAYPAWSVIMIAIDIIVIYAIVVHGRELDA